MKHSTRSIVRFTQALSLAATLALGAAPALASTATFEEYNPASGTVLFTPTVISGGFLFSQVTGQIGVADNSQPNVPNTGSNTLLANGGTPSSFSMTAVSGGTFDLFSLLAIEGRNTNTGFFSFSATGVTLLGSFNGGGSISTTLTFDLFAQENNLLDSQLFTFSGWTNLDSILFTGVGGNSNGYSFGFDDISSTAGVPDNGVTVTLLGSALLGLATLRRKFVRA